MVRESRCQATVPRIRLVLLASLSMGSVVALAPGTSRGRAAVALHAASRRGRLDELGVRERSGHPVDGFEVVTFRARDSLLVTADLYRVRSADAPIILLFHQSGSSRGEYRAIAPRLVDLGFNCLAVDTRWGDKDRWAGVENETAKRFGTATIVASGDRSRRRAARFAARLDLDAALAWARSHQFRGRVIVWGSSWSSILVFDLASERPDDVSGIISFSPGEYDDPDRPTLVRGWAAAARQPALVVSGAAEDSSVAPIYQAIRAPGKLYYRAMRGVHGSSILLEEPEAWGPVESFLRQFLN
jgi:dienelactone hydrolase